MPLPDKDDLAGRRELLVHARAAARAAALLSENGLELDEEDEDRKAAAALATAYAEDPENTSKEATAQRLAAFSPETLIMVSGILDTFGQSVVKNAVQVRHMVTNKLLIETENPDPRVRLKALELLGKITDVGLFADKSEVTVTHQTADDVRSRLRAKLTKMKDVTPDDAGDDILDAEIVPATDPDDADA